jgi:hypothetical protein
MANRYWVGGAGTWNTTSTTNWSASSGGASGASAPTAADDIFFDQAGTYTVTVTAGLCRNITVSAGTVTFSGVTTGPTISGSMSLAAATVWNIGATRTTTFNATTTGQTITTNGVTLSCPVTFDGVGGGWTLGSALTLTQALTVTNGSFDSGNYNITTVGFSSSNTNTRSISLGSSTVTISIGLSTALNLGTTTGLTWNAGTSQINLTSPTTGIASGGVTFNNVAFTNSAVAATITITGANTFNTLSFVGRGITGVNRATFSDNQTISTLTLNAGTTAAYRTMLQSDAIGTTRTLAVTTLTAGAADYDFRDIAVTGSAAPLSVTRAGDCKGNSGITFPAAKTVYYRQTGSANWGTAGSGSWSLTSGGALDATAFPLAQDTAVFPAATYPASGSTTTLSNNYNIGTIDMSLRTTNTMTLATTTSTLTIYGDWINGTGITLSGTTNITFCGRGSQSITSAGKTFTQRFNIETPSGSVTLQDAIVLSNTTSNVINLTTGTFDANGYAVTFSATVGVTGFGTAFGGTQAKTLAIGSGTWTLAGSGTPWNITGSNLTVTGTGTISLTSASAKTFTGGDIQTYPTINQGGTGTLTITGANTFANITNTAIGNITFPASTTTTVSAFNVSGNSTTRVQLRSSSPGTRFTLSDSSGTVSVDWLDIQDSSATGGAAWYAGANSLNTANNLGWIFTAPPSVSYGGNFFAFF